MAVPFQFVSSVVSLGRSLGLAALRPCQRFLERQEHSYLIAIRAITLTELRYEVTLFEPDAEQDVPGRRHREHEVPERHDRRGPEGEDEAEVNRMADVAIEPRRAEVRLWQLPTTEPRDDLEHSEKLEVADEEGADEHQSPADPRDGLKDVRRPRLPHGPDGARDRLPLPAEQGQRKAREEHVRTPLDRPRHHARPPALERGPRHDAVLYGEEPEKSPVHQQRGGRQSTGVLCVDRLGYHDVLHESDRVEERPEKQHVDDDSVDCPDDAPHGSLRLQVWVRNVRRPGSKHRGPYESLAHGGKMSQDRGRTRGHERGNVRGKGTEHPAPRSRVGA